MFVIRVSIIVWMLALAHAACAGSSASDAKAEYADVLTKFRNQTFVTSYDVMWPTGRRLGQLTMAHDGGSSYVGLRSGGLQLDWYLTGNESIICQAASCRATPRVEASAAFLDLDEPTTPVGEIRETESAGATAGQRCFSFSPGTAVDMAEGVSWVECYSTENVLVYASGLGAYTYFALLAYARCEAGFAEPSPLPKSLDVSLTLRSVASDVPLPPPPSSFTSLSRPHERCDSALPSAN